MILQGKNLIISANGSVLAASKSCSLDVDVDTIKVSSPTDGEWEHSIAGRKSWKISTSHLIPNIMAHYPLVTAYSPAWIEIPEGKPATTKFTYTAQQQNYSRGLTLYMYYTLNGLTWTVDKIGTFDTLSSASGAATAQQRFVQSFTLRPAFAEAVFFVITSVDAFTITSGMQAAIATNMNISTDDIPLIDGHGAFAAIGGKSGTGICVAHVGKGAAAHAMAYFVDNTAIETIATPLRDAVARVGQTFDIRVQVDGYGGDQLRGTAICKAFKAQGTLGNLLQGSFSWQGTGPLE